MQLSFETKWIDPDDGTIEVEFYAENSTHKTTIRFYNTTNFLKAFTRELKAFPFEDNKTVLYEYGELDQMNLHLKLSVRLANASGLCAIDIQTEDSTIDAKAIFSEYVEVGALQALADKIQSHDFTVLNNPFIWNVKAYNPSGALVLPSLSSKKVWR